MKKNWILLIIGVLLLLLGSFTAMKIYMNNKSQDSNIVSNKKLANMSYEKVQNNVEESVNTSSTEEKTSPKGTLIEKQYYKGCDHLVTNTKALPKELVNLTEQELAKTLQGWKIEKFTGNEVTIYQEKDGFCNQHYLIKENNGVLGVYTVDEKGKETLKENTEIQTQYLTPVDLEKVSKGIEAIGDSELNTVLEDFE